MLSQEEIFFFLEDIASEMREMNIPILNDIHVEFPTLMTKDEILKLKSVYDASESDTDTQEEEN